MRILANENFPGPLIVALRDRAYDVVAVKEVLRGADDRVILQRAQSENRILVTFDKDFGELAFRLGLPAQSGVILFRLTGSKPELDNARALAAIESRADWAGHFAVVTDDRRRMRPLGLSPSSGEVPPRPDVT
jgi:predicted nuclease of predicted toxin-antitoxin system